MKRVLWIGAAMLVLWGLPRLSHPAVDIGKLEPVELVRIASGSGGVTIETDKGNCGSGETLAEAVQDLKQSSGAEVFLDTANRILVTEISREDLIEILELFRPSARICKAQNDVDLTEAVKYLSIHPPELTLNNLRNGNTRWQIFTMKEGRGSLAYME